MNYQHKEMASGRWFEISFFAQMANIGSEVERSIKWKNKNNKKYFESAFMRVIELLDLTISDKRNIHRLKELLRVRETLIDYFLYDNEYGSSDKLWQKYFYAFSYAYSVSRH